VLEGKKRTGDFSINLERLTTLLQPIQYIKEGEPPIITKDAIIIDALFGTGLSKPLDGLSAELVKHINQTGNRVISIDMPSGLMADISSATTDIIRAHHTLSFQAVKLAFMMTENGIYTGQVHLLDIDLHPDFYDVTPSSFYTTGMGEVALIYNPRNQYAHKYNFGHALLYAGSKNMMGAAILCAKACLRAGCGLVTVHTETGTQPVIQASFPKPSPVMKMTYSYFLRKKLQ
jgi:NAD(P)H-hydrate epimerase